MIKPRKEIFPGFLFIDQSEESEESEESSSPYKNSRSRAAFSSIVRRFASAIFSVTGVAA